MSYKAMDWYSYHPEYASPTTLTPATRGFSVGTAVPPVNNSQRHYRYPKERVVLDVEEPYGGVYPYALVTQQPLKGVDRVCASVAKVVVRLLMRR